MRPRVLIDNRPEAYVSFMVDDFPGKVAESTRGCKPLHSLVGDMLYNWRAASYSAVLPALIPSALKEFHDAYTNDTNPNAGILRFSDAIIASLCRKVHLLSCSPELRGEIRRSLVETAAEIVHANANLQTSANLEEIWDWYLKEPAFAFGVSSSMQLALVAIYSAFENFVVRALRLASNDDQLRVTPEEKFKDTFRNYFGDLYDRGWQSKKMLGYRAVRNSFLHAGGKITSHVKKYGNPIRECDGYLYVFPEHNKELYELACPIIWKIVNNPAFRSLS